MNHKFFSLTLHVAALIALVTLIGCTAERITGSGTVVSREYDFTGFDEIDISHTFRVNITAGDDYHVVVRVDDNLVDKLLVEQKEDHIAIALQPGSLVTNATLEADVTMPMLSRLSVSGAGLAQVSGFDLNDTLTAKVSGASRIHGDIAANDVELEASGASTIELAGTGANVEADASGASTIDLEKFAATDAQVKASGASTIIINIEGILDVGVSGASNVYYVGNPEMGIIKTSGGSHVSPR